MIVHCCVRKDLSLANCPSISIIGDFGSHWAIVHKTMTINNNIVLTLDIYTTYLGSELTTGDFFGTYIPIR